LKILELGCSCHFEISNYSYRFLVSIETEKALQKREIKILQFELKNPSYRVSVFKEEKLVTGRDSKLPIYI
jgi:hypothetical protein